jgi:hypothetical protein
MSTSYLRNCQAPRSFETEGVTEKDFLLEERPERFPNLGGSGIFKCRIPELMMITSV